MHLGKGDFLGVETSHGLAGLRQYSAGVMRVPGWQRGIGEFATMWVSQEGLLTSLNHSMSETSGNRVVHGAPEGN
jgi:hypothetical protein